MFRKTARKGSYTIELTLLMPIILGLILFLLFAGYYMHDRAVIEKTIYIAAQRGALCVTENRRIEIARSSFEKEIEGRLMAQWSHQYEISNQDNGIAIDYSGRMEMVEGLLRKIIKDKGFLFETRCFSGCANETEYLRKHKLRD